MRHLACLIGFFALAACAGAPRSEALAQHQALCEAPPIATDRALQPRFDAIVDAAAAEGFAGQVSIMRDGAYIYRRVAGAADLEGAIPVTQDTLFHVASITKYFTAALVIDAVNRGDLSLNSPLAPFAPGTAFATSAITINELLAHRSGLGSSYAAEAHNDPDQAVAAIATEYDPANAGPYRYSNDGYDLLGIVMERTGGAPYEAQVRNLASRACVSRIGFWGEGATDARHVSQPLTPLEPDLLRRNYGMLGSAGLLITADSLVAWQDALRTGRIFPAAAFETLIAPRGAMSRGEATYGGFLVQHPRLGRVFSARGSEDWGDNAILNDYLECGVTLAIVTSRGPAEESGRPLFRNSISAAIEAELPCAGR